MKKKFSAILAILAILGASLAPAPAAWAADGDGDNCDGSFLGLKAWHAGLPKGDKCAILPPAEGSEGSELPKFVWTIALNILADLFAVIGYAAIGYMIYGGWFYLRSEGDPAMIAKGKKTLVSAAIGVGIALLATVIVNTISALLNAATS